MFHCLFFLTGAPPRGRRALTFFLLAFKLSKNSRKLPAFLTPSSVRLRVQKYYIFDYLQQLFSLFFKLFPFMLSVRKIHFRFSRVFLARKGVLRSFYGFLRHFYARFTLVHAGFPRVPGGNPRAFHKFQSVLRRNGLGSSPRPFGITHYYIYIDVLPVGTLPRTPAAYMANEAAPY